MDRRSHSGQALVVMLAFMASMIGMFLLVYNTGQVVNDKVKLTNAADAAAYSAALWEARSLNFQAYMNRAIVANEVAIAQLVSLRSWSQYLGTLTTNARTVLQWVPPLATPLNALQKGWQSIDRSLQASLPIFEGSLSNWNVLALAQAQAMAQQQAAIGAADLVEKIALANEPRAQLGDANRILQVRNGAVWQNRFTQRYERGSGDLRRFSNLLMTSRDGFTRSRRNDLPIPIPLVSAPRRGGTDLIGEYSWRGVDSWSVHINALFGSTEIPLAWGAAEQRRQVMRQQGDHGGSLRTNPRASRLAVRALRPSQTYQGLPQIRDVIAPQRQDQRSLEYSVSLRLPAANIQTTDRLLAIADMSPNLAAGAIHALGSAQLYFQRPTARADGRQEFASLFSPFWQARLIATPIATRALTAASRGMTLDPYAVLP
jgi:Putative Flp pilus-assembly TadE/G-like